jgi:hypothetical protein
MKFWQKRCVACCAIFATAGALSYLTAQTGVAAANKNVTIVFVGGWEPPWSNGATPEMDAVQAALQADFQGSGYTVTVAVYAWDGTGVSNPSRSLTQDLLSNPSLLNYAACFSAGCNTLNDLLETDVDGAYPVVQQLLAVDPETPPTNGLASVQPLAMDLNSDTDVRMIVSSDPTVLDPIQPGVPPVGGDLLSTMPLPTDHANVLSLAETTGILQMLFEDVAQDAIISEIFSNLPTDPSLRSGPVSGVPSPGTAGMESHLLTGVGTPAFRTLSNYRYFHVRK